MTKGKHQWIARIERPPNLTPREFCRLMQGINSLPPEKIAQIEESRAYQRACNQLFSEIFCINRHSVSYFGKAPDYSTMPHSRVEMLGFIYEAHRATKELDRLKQAVTIIVSTTALTNRARTRRL